MTTKQIAQAEKKQLMDEVNILNMYFKIKDIPAFIKEHGSLEVAHSVLCQRFDQRPSRTKTTTCLS